MEQQTRYLQPGEIIVLTESTTITTILGSCVSVCLFDKDLKVSGMNHFIFPILRKNTREANKFGDVSTQNLINAVVDKSHKKVLFAKIFGGACLNANSPNLFNIGKQNVEIARSVLSENNIKIMSNDTGGILGRRIEFITAEGLVKVKYIKNLAQEQ